jgi:MAF protein
MSETSSDLGGPPPDHIKAAREHSLPIRQSAPPRKGPISLDIPILTYLKSKRVILASASPRRKALLGQVHFPSPSSPFFLIMSTPGKTSTNFHPQLGLTNLEVLPSTEPENLDKKTYGPHEYVAATARQKCLSVYEAALQNHLASIPDPDVVIAADTVIVTRDGAVLEKPRSETDHIKMLKHLRDTRVHRVLTAVCVLAPRDDARHPGYEIAAHTEETKVYFASESDGLPDDVVEAYVRTREGADKAGGYAVQGIGGMVLVERVEGSVDNVIGLPVRKCLSLAEKVVFQQGEEERAEGDEEEDG